jgi:hypothetical protein
VRNTGPGRRCGVEETRAAGSAGRQGEAQGPGPYDEKGRDEAETGTEGRREVVTRRARRDPAGGSEGRVGPGVAGRSGARKAPAKNNTRVNRSGLRPSRKATPNNVSTWYGRALSLKQLS